MTVGSSIIADELSRLRGDGVTGILRVTGERWPQSEIFLMDGEIIACTGPDDETNLERILLSSQMIEESLLGEWRPWLDEGADLVDMMVADGRFSTEELVVARSSLFDDNFAWALAHPEPQVDFEKREAVFPDNIQFDLDGSVLIGDVVGWIESVEGVLSAAASDRQVFSGTGEMPEGWLEEDWEHLCQQRTMGALLNLLGPPRTEATMLISEWLATGVVVQVDGEAEATAAEPAATAGEEDDYARAARGDFVRSYEVLDKVDLTGVPILGLGTDPVDDPEATLDQGEAMVEAGEETLPPVELGEYREESGEAVPGSPGAATADEAVEEAPPAEMLENAPPRIDDWDSMSDEPPPIHGDDDFAAPAESWANFQAIDSLEALEPTDGAPPPIPGAATEFSVHELQAFGDRIETFNQIFRIIYETFAAHLGDPDTQHRFADLLGSSSREQAALFVGLQPGADGSLSGDILIANLAGMATDAPEILLKGGLYELLFSHLSDSKDLLPGEVEATMMERLVVYEQQLNQP